MPLILTEEQAMLQEAADESVAATAVVTEAVEEEVVQAIEADEPDGDPRRS